MSSMIEVKIINIDVTAILMNALSIIFANAFINFYEKTMLVFIILIVLDITIADYEYCCAVYIETVRTVKKKYISVFIEE